MNKKTGVFQNPNIRRYLIGQICSFIGGMLQSAVIAMLVVKLTDKQSAASTMGHVIALTMIPGIVLAPFAGVIVDRVNRKTILLITSMLGALQSLALAWCVYTNSVSIFWINSLTLCLGFIVAIDGNCRNAILRDIVTDIGEIRQASQYLTSLYTIAQMAGSGIAGYVVLWVGYSGAFVLNALSYGAIIVALLSIKLLVGHGDEPHPKQKMIKSTVVGLQYLFATQSIRTAVLLMTLLLFLTYPYQMLIPVITKYTFHGDELTYSHLAFCNGLGSLIGSFIPIRFHGILKARLAVIIGMIGTALCMVALALTGNFAIALVCIFCAGLGYASTFGILRGYITAMTDRAMVGIVGGWSAACWYGGLTLSSVLFGVVADTFGPASVLIGCGLATLVIGIVTSRLQSMKDL